MAFANLVRHKPKSKENIPVRSIGTMFSSTGSYAYPSEEQEGHSNLGLQVETENLVMKRYVVVENN